MNARRTLLSGSALVGAALALSVGAPPASAQDRDALILLGKNVFFDKQLSTPRGKQACASCHDPKVGWTLPLSNINETTVGAPGAQPGALGGRRPQNNSYVQGFLGVYSPGAFGPVTTGGAFWDGRAEGCGATGGPCPIGGTATEPITEDDLPTDEFGDAIHAEFLGAVAEQALNPTARPGVEQNTREKSDCQIVKTAKYKDLYEKAWGEPIDCNQQGDPPAFHISFKRLAVAVAAWQGSPDVNSFTSPRDDCIRRPAQFDNDATPGKFPCANLSAQANLGHDLFYGRNDTGRNRIVPNPGPVGPPQIPLNAGCSGCHNNKGPGSDGNEPDQVYADFAYHSIALPFNRELSRDDADPGLFAHDDLPNNLLGLGDEGTFKTPTLRNATKGESNTFTKAYMHNGYFKRIEDVVHFYNTRFVKPVCANAQATAAEAIAADCWPPSEWPGTEAILPALLGNLGLDTVEEAALVAYIKTLEDSRTPTAPDTVK